MSKVIHNPALAKIIDNSDNSSTFVIEPLHFNYGNTLGNSLRRVLLSSIRGGAIVAFRIEGATHEFTTVPGIQEDVDLPSGHRTGPGEMVPEIRLDGRGMRALRGARARPGGRALPHGGGVQPGQAAPGRPERSGQDRTEGLSSRPRRQGAARGRDEGPCREARDLPAGPLPGAAFRHSPADADLTGNHPPLSYL